MAKWAVPRNNSDMETNGGTIKGATSFEAEKNSNGEITVINATSNSELMLEGTKVTGLRTAVQNGYKWSVTSTELQDAYDTAAGKAFVDVGCSNTEKNPVLYLNTDNNYSLIPD